MSTEMPTDLYDLLEAIEAALAAADPAKRDALAKTIDAYAQDFPDEFYWGVQRAGSGAPLSPAYDYRCGVSPRGRI